MPAPNPLTWLPLWERALDPKIEIGIGFTISGVDREYFRNTLYECRKLALPNNSRLNELIMFLPAAPHDSEIWICKKEVELGENA